MRCIAVLAAAALLPAQTEVFTRAAPEVDEALRANVSKFFQAHVDGKYRVAEEVVAPESSDYFYESEKKRYKSFEITKIDYSENFTKAVVVMALGLEWRTPRLGKIDVTAPATSLWKLVDGKWSWYVEPQKDWKTPFGTMTPGPDNNTKESSAMAALFKGVTPEQVRGKVQISRSELQLSSVAEASASAEIVNRLTGPVKLQVDTPAVRGLEVKLDKSELKPNEQATLTFHYAPETKEPKETIIALVNVSPTGQIFPIKITFSVPTEPASTTRKR